MATISRLLEPTLVEKLNQLSMSARRVVEGSTVGLHRSPIKGASVEFRQHRSYVPGDEPRRLDWRLLGRTDRAYVKEYDEETNLRSTLVLDASGSMAYGPKGSKFDYARRLAAALAYLMLARTESAGLAIAGSGGDEVLPAKASSSQLARVIELLERTTAKDAQQLDTTLTRLAERTSRRSLVIVLSDLFLPVDRLRAGLARLRHGRHEVVVVRVLHPDEITFPFRQWFEFRGLESEKSRMIEASLVRSQYLQKFEKHRDALTAACRGADAEMVLCRTDRPVIESVVAVIARKSREP